MTKKRIANQPFRISFLDRYIIKELISTFIFSIAICSVLGELIGISFEQIGFALEENLPLKIVFYIHWLKLPAFICIALPFALLIATISSYTKLSNRNEIIALQSIGVNLYRPIIPSLATACVFAVIMFIFQELIIPPANYQAATILEKQLNIDRTQLAKYNKKDIVYHEFETEKSQKYLKLLFFAERFDGKKMRDITLLRFKHRKLKKIIIARSAQWNGQKQQWQLFTGRISVLSNQNTYISSDNFEQLSLKLTRKIFDYANHHRDKREMNIIELYNRLAIVKHTGNTRNNRELKISIQERYATPFSCIVFTFLGSALGISLKTKANYNSFGIAAIVIFIYYSTKFLSTALSVAEVIPIFWGVWFPNLLALCISFIALKRKY